MRDRDIWRGYLSSVDRNQFRHSSSSSSRSSNFNIFHPGIQRGNIPQVMNVALNHRSVLSNPTDVCTLPLFFKQFASLHDNSSSTHTHTHINPTLYTSALSQVHARQWLTPQPITPVTLSVVNILYTRLDRQTTMGAGDKGKWRFLQERYCETRCTSIILGSDNLHLYLYLSLSLSLCYGQRFLASY